MEPNPTWGWGWKEKGGYENGQRSLFRDGKGNAYRLSWLLCRASVTGRRCRPSRWPCSGACRRCNPSCRSVPQIPNQSLKNQENKTFSMNIRSSKGPFPRLATQIMLRALETGARHCINFMSDLQSKYAAAVMSANNNDNGDHMSHPWLFTELHLLPAAIYSHFGKSIRHRLRLAPFIIHNRAKIGPFNPDKTIADCQLKHAPQKIGNKLLKKP